MEMDAYFGAYLSKNISHLKYRMKSQSRIFRDEYNISDQAGCFEDTQALSRRAKACSISGFVLLSGKEPCPLSLPYGFLSTQPDLLLLFKISLQHGIGDASSGAKEACHSFFSLIIKRERIRGGIKLYSS